MSMPPHSPPPYGYGPHAAPPFYGHAAPGYALTPQQQHYHATQAANAEKGRKLVSASRWLLLAGCLVMFGGCGGGIALQSGGLAFSSGTFGFLVVIAAAIVGQIGRGFQGRAI